MLQIQRASAGSGKTFTLARRFIWNLIAYRQNNGQWKLRNPRHIDDVLPRILAITFTNKATNEMKQRIVGKLSAMALAADSKNITPEYLKNTDYIKEFAEKAKVSYEEIGESCRHALRSIINNYSLFRISTIDAFFQEILRTFAYEANINDSFQLEIDSDFIEKAAIDTTLNELDTANRNSDASFWLKIIMANNSGKNNNWNLFNKSDSKLSLYSEVKNALHKLDSEEFKKIRPELEEFFRDDKGGHKLRILYTGLQKKISEERNFLLPKIEELRSNILSYLQENPFPEGAIKKSFQQHLEKLDKLNLKSDTVGFAFDGLFKTGSVFMKSYKGGGTAELDSQAMELYSLLSQWENSDAVLAWKYYGALLPFFGVSMEIFRKMGEVLESNNLLQLSDTNFLLKKIIGEDDTPFIYERLGSYIENYLIDEFQDTSQMQWEVLRPLLSEGISKGLDSLIIGDPKQSIYRFRNADSSLITTKVPQTFKDHKAAGMSKEENTNWRSKKVIVEFNNLFFANLAMRITEISSSKGENRDFTRLYSNVVQFPHNRQDQGYVEINFINTVGGEANEDEEDPDFEDTVLPKIGPLIDDIRSRGYRLKDIGILVNTNNSGKRVIDTLVKYNENLPAGSKPIEFISEQSLYISSSRAVEIIVSVIEKIAEGSVFLNEDLKKEEASKKENYTNLSWNSIKVNFYYYALQHPELSPEDQITSFIKDSTGDETIRKMIASMQVPTLPAIVEAVVENFISGPMRKEQAIFIAAFQDLVLDYCEKYTNDPGSFLEWWKQKGKYLAISSPEDIDAVQIMTIHKSKGLEFKCVIIPFATDALTPNGKKPEWRWVKPFIDQIDDIPFPPYLPVNTTKSLLQTPHGQKYKEFYDQVMMDKLNMYYVAFTRAVDELYIFTKSTEKPSSSIAYFLKNICLKADPSPVFVASEEREWMIDPAMMEISEDESTFSFGKKADLKSRDKEAGDKEKSEKKEDKTGKGNEQKVSKKTLDDYFVNGKRPQLIYSPNETPESQQTEEEAEGPRSEGNLMHTIMSKVKKSSDLSSAVTFAKARGWIKASELEHYESFIRSKIERPEVENWFSGEWTVMNERSIFTHFGNKRPDRIMISKDRGKAIIVDYKFGTSENKSLVSKYKRQVANYMKLLREALKLSHIEGYLWFVNEDILMPVRQ